MRNRKPEYIKKFAKIETSNGFKADISNYLYNPDYNHDYPNLIKREGNTITSVRYFKFYDGGAEYQISVYEAEKEGSGSMWSILKEISRKELKAPGRFSINNLIKIAEAL